MRATSANWRRLIGYSHPVVTVVESWYGGALTLPSVPFTAGQIQYDDTGNLKRRLTLTVPARIPAMNLDPGNDPLAPLAAYGQRLHVRTGIGYPDGSQELLDHGWYLITSWSRTGNDALSVEAADLAQLLADNDLTTASSPPAGATYMSEFTRLMDGAFATVRDPALVDRPIGRDTVWQADRMLNLQTLCGAWPARWFIGDDGKAHVAPPYPVVADTDAPAITFTDGVAGTVIRRSRGLQRGALYNVVAVTGRLPDDQSKPAPFAVAQIISGTSPIRANGPYGKVVRAYASDLITTQAQAQATANAGLDRWSSHGRAESADVVPDPSVELGDVARLYSAGSSDPFTGRVTAITVPLTPGVMSLSITNVPADNAART